VPTAQSPHDQSTERDDVAGAMLALGAATLGETGGRVMRPGIAAAWPGAALAAPAYTVRCAPGDNLPIHVAVTQAPAGSALVVDVGGAHDFGYWGEVLTTAALARGLAGLVIDGGVRDVAALEAHGFPVFSALVALQGATKQLPGDVGGAVDVGDAPVATGDWIVGDRDGVTVVPAGRLDAVLAAGRERATKETHLFAELRAGRTTVELLELDGTRVSIH
jgi:4-hydroxy-4-methyl-2-oxoglutarate aldolase